MTAPRLHHVANGSSTTALIERAGLPGTRSIWGDPLHEGPVPGDLSDSELMAVRARHLADGADASLDEVTAELRRWRAAVDDTGAYDELVLWYEHDLFDQLNVLQLLVRIGKSVAATRAVTLVSIDTFPGHSDFRGLGELTPAELGSLLETRRPVTAAQLGLAERAWDAFRSADPRAIEGLLADDTEALPFLAPALGRHLEELPSTVDGLSRTERRILELARRAPIDIGTAFRRVSDGETAFYIADLSFWRLVADLRSATPALVDISAAATGATALPRGTIALTATGRDVLDGRVDRVARCGIDRWLGGARLEGHGPVWRFDPETRRVVFR